MVGYGCLSCLVGGAEPDGHARASGDESRVSLRDMRIAARHADNPRP